MKNSTEWLAAYGGDILEEFLDIYKCRPITDNSGGVGINHAYGLYFTLKQLNPKYIIESGVYKGQSTWLIEQAQPNAEIHCIDPSPEQRIYSSCRANYHTDDFAGINWSDIDCRDSVCFFDDHQSALSRLKDMKWWGFKRAIFEDNYPTSQGDCYSIRKILAKSGHPLPNLSLSKNEKQHFLKKLFSWKAAHTGINGKTSPQALEDIYWRQDIIRKPNEADFASFSHNLSIYFEYPPLLINTNQRWEPHKGWNSEYALMASPLYNSISDSESIKNCLESLTAEALVKELSYTYMCYVELH